MFKMILNNGKEINLTYPKLMKEMNIRGMMFSIDVKEQGGFKKSMDTKGYVSLVSLGSTFVMAKVEKVN